MQQVFIHRAIQIDKRLERRLERSDVLVLIFWMSILCLASSEINRKRKMYPSRAGDNIWHYWIIPPLISQGNHSRWEQQEAMKNVVYLQKAKLGPFIMYIFLRCRWQTKFPSPNMVWESPRSQNGTWCWPQMERKKGYGQLSANIRCPDAVEGVGQLDASGDTKQSAAFIYEHNTKQIVNVHHW